MILRYISILQSERREPMKVNIGVAVGISLFLLEGDDLLFFLDAKDESLSFPFELNDK